MRIAGSNENSLGFVLFGVKQRRVKHRDRDWDKIWPMIAIDQPWLTNYSISVNGQVRSPC